MSVPTPSKAPAMSPRTQYLFFHAAIRRSLASRSFLCGAVVIAMGSWPLSAQDTIQIAGDELTCPACVITVDSVLTIGGLDGPGLEVIDRASRVAIDRMGRILVSVYRSAEIAVFDSSGAFLRTFGRWGEGPGEYALINHVNVGPRYIHVFDIRGRTVLDHDFDFVRQDRFPAQRSYSHVADTEDVIFTGVVPTRTSAGNPLHILNLSGEVESFGGRGPVVGDPGWDLWPITGGTQSIWVLEGGDTNHLTKWNIASLPRNWKVYKRNGEADLNDLTQDDRGLWVIWGLPDGGRWLDLVDPATGRTIARSHDDAIQGVFVDGTGAMFLRRYHESDAGVPYITLFRVSLRSP